MLDVIEEFLTDSRHRLELDRVLATVMSASVSFAPDDDRGGTSLRDRVDRFYAHARKELEWFRGRRLETQPNGFLSTFDGPARAIRCACAITAAASRFGADVRIGLHTGECEIRNDQIGGVAVETCAQVAARAAKGQVLVSRTVKDLVAGSGLRFEDRGEHSLAGVPGEWRLFAVERGIQAHS
jgi:class 3 adenylate cyclase